MINISKQNCCGCTACAEICPKKCIKMEADSEGFLYPIIDKAECINCGVCEKVCPVLQENPDKTNNMPDCYAAINKDEPVRLASSSGGMFTLFAQEVLKQDGIVYGAAMTDDCRSAKHIVAENEAELDKLRGSKYMQSEIGNTYIEVKKQLDSGRIVLFTGTPCQVEGLHTFLSKDYENLLCIDLICHGVPSPKVWRKYVDFRETSARASARRTFFRHKKHGWKTFAVLFEFSNNTAYEQISSRDLFMQAFLRNACLRPSCYNCHFKKINRKSDITLADFWGIDNVAPEMDDDKGTSLVLIHTNRGKQLFTSMEDKIVFKKIDTEKAIAGNPAIRQSVSMPQGRQNFFNHLDMLPFDKLVKKYAKEKITAKGVAVKILRKTGLLKIAKKAKNAIK